jgi:hypothetical protein
MEESLDESNIRGPLVHFKPGDFVQAHSLKTAVLNGAYGKVVGAQDPRVTVQFLDKSHEVKALKPLNLRAVELVQVIQGLLDGIQSDVDKATIQITESGARGSLTEYSILDFADAGVKQALVLAAQDDFMMDRTMGSMMGMAVGDAVGAPLEFLPAVDEATDRYFDLKTMTCQKEFNKFCLRPGQWTDDCSMGLCMADSLIMQKVFDGSDMRVRFWCWWNRGYNNAFRFEGSDRKGRPSIGLGGNISASLEDAFEAIFSGGAAHQSHVTQEQLKTQAMVASCA